jgi:hypothetical protein
MQKRQVLPHENSLPTEIQLSENAHLTGNVEVTIYGCIMYYHERLQDPPRYSFCGIVFLSGVV